MGELREGDVEKAPPNDGRLSCDMMPPRHSSAALTGGLRQHRRAGYISSGMWRQGPAEPGWWLPEQRTWSEDCCPLVAVSFPCSCFHSRRETSAARQKKYNPEVPICKESIMFKWVRCSSSIALP